MASKRRNTFNENKKQETTEIDIMKVLFLLGLVGWATAGHVSVQMPYINPAGVTYTGLAAGSYSPLLSSRYLSAATTYGHLASPALTAYSHLAAAPAVAVTPAPYTTYSHVAAPAVTTYSHAAAAPAVAVTPAPITTYSHVAAAPAVATYSHAAVTPAPVTTYSHVAAAPAITTYSHVAAAPAVAVTPAPVLPLSPVQLAHPGFIRKVVDVAKPSVATRNFEVRRPAVHKQFYDVEQRVVVRPAGSALVELEHPSWQAGPTVVTPSQPAPQPPQQPQPQQPINIPQTPQFDDSDSVAVDNPDLARNAPRDPAPNGQDAPEARNGVQENQAAQSSQAADSSQSAQSSQSTQSAQFSQSAQYAQLRQLEQQTQPAPQPSSRSGSGIGAEFRSLSELSFNVQQLEANQARLIELLTARGGVTEVGDPARVRARVLSVGEGEGVPKESVSTRRLVVNRPVQTVQRVQLLQPFTKIERVALDQPATILKTAHAAPLLAHPQYATYLH
ncbi:hypothetical protein AAG570_010987 [Ranatra chinensis]|uniref:Uncharacterized protein n=1 Tax=Ranatra chinensis TaxID=642074 RepID=A0ABD0YJB8_9HEMI